MLPLVPRGRFFLLILVSLSFHQLAPAATPCVASITLNTRIKFHFHPDFEKKGAFERFTQFTLPALEAALSKIRLSAKEEAEWFLRYNFLKYQADKKLQEAKHQPDPQPLLLETTTWLERAIAVRQFLQLTNQGLIGSAAARFQIHTLSPDDLFSEGQTTLIKAIEGFDVGLGYRFSTYASAALRSDYSNILKRTIKRLGHEQQVVEHFENASSVLDKAVEGEGSDVLDVRRQNEINEIVAQLLPLLDERKQQVIALRFGLFDKEPLTLTEVGAILGRCKERIRQIESKALQEMRDHAKLRKMEIE